MPPSASPPGYKQSYVASPHDLHRRQSKAPNPTVLLSWQTKHDPVRKTTLASDGGCRANPRSVRCGLETSGYGYELLGVYREQVFLMPPDPRDWLPEGHLAWFVLASVEEMDLAAFYGSYRAGWVGPRGV